MLVELNHSLGGRIIPICKTIATTDAGITDLNRLIDVFFTESQHNGELHLRRSRRRRQELIERIRDHAAKRVQAIIAIEALADTVSALEDGSRDIYSVQQEIEHRLFK